MPIVRRTVRVIPVGSEEEESREIVLRVEDEDILPGDEIVEERHPEPMVNMTRTVRRLARGGRRLHEGNSTDVERVERNTSPFLNTANRDLRELIEIGEILGITEGSLIYRVLQLEKRSRLHYGLGIWSSYLSVNNADKAQHLSQFVNDLTHSHLDNQLDPLINNPPDKKSPEKGKVALYEDSSKIVDTKETVFLPEIGGHFLKDDPRLIKNFFNRYSFIIFDKKYESLYIRVYTDIKDNGELVCDKTYTTGGKKDGHPVASIKSSDGRNDYILVNLIDNPIFYKYYQEDMWNGIFYPISKKLKAFERIPKVGYLKHKNVRSFLKDTEGLPTTYSNTFGKRYKFGIEIETISGFLPSYLTHILYYSAVHDGSLREPDGSGPYGKLK